MPATFTNFPVPTANAGLNYITTGPDGNLWFTEAGVNQIGRITTAGTVTEFSALAGGSNGSQPNGITTGPDGNLWYTLRGGNSGISKIARMTTAGVVTEFSAGLTQNSNPSGITVGPDGALWFTEQLTNMIGRIDTSGNITEFGTGITGTTLSSIVAGPDGNLWFTESLGNIAIGRITTAGVVTEFRTGLTAGSRPAIITVGSDGNLWFTEESSNKIGRITTAGTITEFDIPTANTQPFGIALGPDGAVYFNEINGHKIGRAAPDGTITEFTNPSTNAAGLGITQGPDRAMWFVDSANNVIGRMTVDIPAPPQPAPNPLPVVVNSFVNGGGTQHSHVFGFTIVFNGPVSIAPGVGTRAFRVTRNDGRVVVIQKVTREMVNGLPALRLHFGLVPDATYTVAVDGNKLLDAQGRPLGQVRTLRFYRMFFDINGNGKIDPTDIGLARQVFKRVPAVAPARPLFVPVFFADHLLIASLGDRLR